MSGDTTIGSNTTGTLSIPYFSTFNGDACTLTVIGTGPVQFNPETVSLGQIVVKSGVLSLRRTNNLGTAPGIPTTVNPGASVELAGDWSISTAQGSPLTLAGGTLVANAGWQRWNGPVSVTTAGGSFLQADDRLYLNGSLSGSGNVASMGGSWLILGGDNSAFAGTLTVTSGWTIVGDPRSGTTGTLPANVTNYSGVAFGRSNDSTYAGIMVGTGQMMKAGASRLTLNGSSPQAFTGSVNINGGTIELDFANLANPTNLLNNNAFGLAGATLSVKGQASTLVTNQSLNGFFVNMGASRLAVSSNGGTATNVELQGITRVVAGTVDFTLPAALFVNSMATTTGNTNGILGGWATVGGTGWATAGGLGPTWLIAPLPAAGYTADAWAAANNTTVTGARAPRPPMRRRTACASMPRWPPR